MDLGAILARLSEFGLGVERPWLLALVLVWLRLPRPPGWIWRFVATIALVSALAGVHTDAGSRRSVVVTDVSESVGPGALDRIAGRDLGEAGLVVFGRTAAIERPIATGSLPGRSSAVVDGSGTNLAQALNVAAGLGPDRILLVSDGAETIGRSAEALPPVPVDVLVVPRRPSLGIAQVSAPPEARPGSTVRVVGVVESDVPAEATVDILENGRVVERREVDLLPGRTPIAIERSLSEPGTYNYEFRIARSTAPEATLRDERLATRVTVTGGPEVLVIGDPVMAGLLEAQGVRVREGTPADIVEPLGVGGIVLSTSALEFNQAQLRLLTRYVEEGGGLLMTGGEGSFGLGGWYRSPLEQALPVDSDVRAKIAFPLVSIVMVIDVSLSMLGGSPRKLPLAQEGAMNLVELANPQDKIGMVTFSDRSRWAFELRQATQRGKLEMLAAISNLQAEGGTILEPGLRMAIEALEQSDSRIKHIIVLSDGILGDDQISAQPVNWAEMAREARNRGITISTIAIGGDADIVRMRQIAENGGGRFHASLDADTLPRIFTAEALAASQALVVERAFNLVVFPHPLGGGLPLSNLPAAGGFISTSLKPDGELILASPGDDPILAVRRFGLGRTAALTIDLERWGEALLSTPGFRGLLASVARWLAGGPPEFLAVAEETVDGVRVTLDAVRGGDYVTGESFIARLEGAERELRQVAPGRYEAILPAPGALPADALIVRDGRVVARTPVSGARREFSVPANPELLERVAARTGGRVLASLDGYSPPTARRPVPIWPAAALATGFAFVGELAWRRWMSRRGAAAGS